MHRFCLLLLFLPWIARTAQAQNLDSVGERLTHEIDELICKKLQASKTVCTVTLESATHHQTAPEVSLWALKWKVITPVKDKSEKAWREILAKKQFQLLDVFPDYVTGITYFRSQAGEFEQLNLAVFSQLALNTRYKAVAHIAPDLFRAGNVKYSLPENWQSDGLKAGDTGAITLTLPQLSASLLTLRVTDLNDAPLKTVHIVSCLMREQDKACYPNYFSLSQKTSTITVTLATEKKLKSSQPAFKLMLQDADKEKVLLSLAIPYRPRPNYLVFGVAGFLFGGLIAVMVLLLRKKTANTVHAASVHRQE
jgi:hypothetical protein